VADVASQSAADHVPLVVLGDQEHLRLRRRLSPNVLHWIVPWPREPGLGPKSHNGVGVIGCESVNVGHVGTQNIYDAGELPPQNDRQRDRKECRTRPDLAVHRIHPGRHGSDSDLAITRFRNRYVLHMENLRPAEL
jgi:hypothetical protein